jgi:hypothetical protein
MNLENAMLESVLRAVLRHPKNCPKRLVWAAKRLRNARKERDHAHQWYASDAILEIRAEEKFKKQIVKHSDKLPAMLENKNER